MSIKTNTLQRRLSLFGAVAMVAQIVSTLVATPAYAAGNLTLASMRLDRMAVSTVNPNTLVVVKPTSTATEGKINIVFDASITVASGASAMTTSTTGLPATFNGTTLTAWPTLGATATAAGQSVTFTSGDLTVGTQYGFFLTAGITLPAAAGAYTNIITTQDASAVAIDTDKVAVRVLANVSSNPGDQVVVTATVPPTFNFALSGVADAFTTDLSSSAAVSTTGVTATVTSNASHGWVAWAKDANSSGGKGSLKSATSGNYLIAGASAVGSAARTLTNNTEDYGLGVALTTDAAGGGTVTVDAAYNSTASTKIGTLDAATLEPIASANGTANGDVITLQERATITGMTPAATDYTDTITVIGAGLF